MPANGSMDGVSLFHLSDQPGIARFEPRPAPDPASGPEGLMVWAIDARHLPNYLLPRDCPRVTYFARPDSDPAHVARLIGQNGTARVVAIEAGWWDRVRRHRLYQYAFPPDTFTCLDAGAGYWISRKTVEPLWVKVLDDLPGELQRQGVDLRILPSLWALRDQVVASTLQYSIIRMRNAQPPPALHPAESAPCKVSSQTPTG